MLSERSQAENAIWVSEWKSLSRVRLFMTPQTIKSMEFSKPEYWPSLIYSSLKNNSLLQEIFPTQGSNPGLPNCRQILYQLSHKGSLKRLYTYNFIFIMLWNYRDGKQVSGCQALKNEWGIWLQKGNTGNPGANWKRMET